MSPRNDRAVIMDPLKWTSPDHLCIKKPAGKGFLRGRLKTGNIRTVWANPDDGGHLIQEYDSLDELLEDGWIVE